MEKEYKNLSKGRFFTFYYWCCVVIIILLSILFSYIFENFTIIKFYFIYITLFALIIIYFYVDFVNIIKILNIKKNEKLLVKIEKYINYNNNNYFDKLIATLKKYNFKTKNDLKLAIDYYNRKQPIKTAPNYLSWFISVTVTISSFIELAYNEITKTFDFEKMSIIINIALQYTLSIAIFVIVVYFLIKLVFFPNNKIYLNIIEDLSYIYLNFNKFKNKLGKK